MLIYTLQAVFENAEIILNHVRVNVAPIIFVSTMSRIVMNRKISAKMHVPFVLLGVYCDHRGGILAQGRQ